MTLEEAYVAYRNLCAFKHKKNAGRRPGWLEREIGALKAYIYEEEMKKKERRRRFNLNGRN